MLQRLVLIALAATCTAAGSQTVRYMPLGDSITQYGCWRAWLGQSFLCDNYTVDFVGTQRSKTTCADLDWDRDHEGHAGYQAINIVAQNQLVGWLRQDPADVMTMHLGTNDILLGNHETADILVAYGKLVDQMRASNPAVRIIVAQIIPLPSAARAVMELNAAIPAWAQSKNETGSPVWVVDQWTNFTTADLKDGIHPSESGDVKMSERFYPALVNAIRSIEGH